MTNKVVSSLAKTISAVLFECLYTQNNDSQTHIPDRLAGVVDKERYSSVPSLCSPTFVRTRLVASRRNITAIHYCLLSPVTVKSFRSLKRRRNLVIPGTLVPGLVAFSFTSVLQKTKKNGQSPDTFPGSHGANYPVRFQQKINTLQMHLLIPLWEVRALIKRTLAQVPGTLIISVYPRTDDR